MTAARLFRFWLRFAFAAFLCGAILAGCATAPAGRAGPADGGLGVRPLIGGGLEVSWTDNTAGLATTRLERRAQGPVSFTDFQAVADVAPGVAVWRDVFPAIDETYCYRALAYVGTDVSPYSTEACGTVAAPPPPTCRQRGKSGKCK